MSDTEKEMVLITLRAIAGCPHCHQCTEMATRLIAVLESKDEYANRTF